VENKNFYVVLIGISFFLAAGMTLPGALALQQVAGTVGATISPGQSKTLSWYLIDDTGSPVNVTISSSGTGSEFLQYPSTMTLRPNVLETVPVTVTIQDGYTGAAYLSPYMFATQFGDTGGSTVINIQMKKVLSIAVNQTQQAAVQESGGTSQENTTGEPAAQTQSNGTSTANQAVGTVTIVPENAADAAMSAPETTTNTAQAVGTVTIVSGNATQKTGAPSADKSIQDKARTYYSPENKSTALNTEANSTTQPVADKISGAGGSIVERAYGFVTIVSKFFSKLFGFA
jgi:hypothetical protein